MHYYDYYHSPYGRMLLVADNTALTGVYFTGQTYHPHIGKGWVRDTRHGLVCQAKRELAEYFNGTRAHFTMKIAPRGTPFQRAVWRTITGVSFGKTISYAELARRAGRPGSARAAGGATGRNPIRIIVPCHRIVGSNGALTGYAGGLTKKRAFLALEGRSERGPSH
ncbi:MAG: methylated-DNA--[protein]-cysteine S-methyltransferase [Nitrospiraceae bacterium]